MSNELNEDQHQRFAAIQAEYRAFYDIRNHPADGVDYEDWKGKLELDQVVAWIENIQAQAMILQTLIKQSEDLKSYRPFHEIRSFFHEDLKALEKELGTEGYTLDAAGVFELLPKPATKLRVDTFKPK